MKDAPSNPRGDADHYRKRSSRLFDIQDTSQGLAKKTVAGGLYTALSSLIIFFVHAAGVILITRNLSDQDFGLYGMVLVFTGFATMFVDIGLAQAVIQKPKISHEVVSTLFWINLGVAGLIALTLASATPLIVWFYDEPRLAPINLVMSLTFILGAFRLQHQALLRRSMAFKAISVIDVTTLVMATSVAVALAYAGMGVWALVSIPMSSQFTSAFLMWIVSGWVPGRPKRGSGVREMLAFGGNVTGFQTIGYFARNSDNLMLGYAWGAGPLGLYTRAYSIMMLPTTKFNAPLSGVVTPILSRIVDDPVRYRRVYLQMVRVCAASLTPLISIILLTIHTTVPLLLGEKWTPIIPIFYALGPLCILKATGPVTNWLYLTIGHVDRLFKWAAITVPFIVIAGAIGLQYGTFGMAIAMSISLVIRRPIGIAYAVRGTPIRFTEICMSILIPILGSAVAALVAVGWLHFFGSSTGLWTQFFVLSAIFTAVYLLLLTLTPAGEPYRSSFIRLKTSLRSK